jgi:hypothetical protein
LNWPLVLYFCACRITKLQFWLFSKVIDAVSCTRSSRNIQPGASTDETVRPGLPARTMSATILVRSLDDVWLLPMNSRLMSAVADGGPEVAPPR